MDSIPAPARAFINLFGLVCVFLAGKACFDVSDSKHFISMFILLSSSLVFFGLGYSHRGVSYEDPLPIAMTLSGLFTLTASMVSYNNPYEFFGSIYWMFVSALVAIIIGCVPFTQWFAKSNNWKQVTN